MEKQDLKNAACALAAEECLARLMYDRFRQGAAGEISAALSEQAQRVAAAAKRADHIRAQIPELSQKQYWWDIPFDIQDPMTEFEDAFVLGQAEFTEQPDFDTVSSTKIVPTPRRMKGDETLSYYLSRSVDAILYLDRKGFKSHLSDQMEVKTIYMYETTETAHTESLPYHGVLPGSWEYNRWARDLSTVSEGLTRDLHRHEERWDTMERFVNQSFFTNRERFIMGQMDADDYFGWALIRENRAEEIERRAEEKRIALEGRMKEAQFAWGRRQFHDSMAAMHDAQTLRLMPCGQVVYCGEQLMAVTLHTGKKPVYEIRHKGEISPFRIEGRVLSLQDILYRTPDPVPVMDFIIQKYTPLMKPWQALSARPKGASDQLWRVWTERRFAYEVSLGYTAQS